MSIKSLFEGQELSQDVLDKIEECFNETLDSKLKEKLDEQETKYINEMEALEEQYKSGVSSYIDDVLTPSVDKYVNTALTEWKKANQPKQYDVAKVELAEKFLDAIKSVITDNKLEISESELNTITQQETTITQLKESLSEMIESIASLETKLCAYKAKDIFEEETKNLTLSQKEKLKTVSEDVTYLNDDQYTNAIKELKESYYPVVSKKQDKTTEQLKESVQLDEQVEEKSLELIGMERYLEKFTANFK